MADFATQAKLLFPWIPAALLPTFVASWTKYTGNVDLAMADLRRSPAYDTYFPGNRRGDGSTRYGEAEYLSIVEGYDRRLLELGQNPSDYRDRYVGMLESGKAPDEFANDLAAVYTEVLQRAPEVRAYFADKFGNGDFSTAAILGSVLQGVSPVEMQQRFRVAQVGGAAAASGFSISAQRADVLADAGLSGDNAREMFAQAAAELPTYRELVARNDDPDDPFTLDDYTDALVLRDPDQLAVLDRALNREKARYTSQDLLSRDQQGGVTGLRQR